MVCHGAMMGIVKISITTCAFILLTFSGCQNASTTPPSTQQALKAEVEDLLWQAEIDRDHWEMRGGMMGDRSIFQFFGQSFWYSLYPVHWAAEQLWARGGAVIDPLLEIATDAKASNRLRMLAWTTVCSFDDPRILPLLLQEYHRGRLDNSEFFTTAQVNLWITNRMPDEEEMRWLLDSIPHKDLGEIRLGILDWDVDHIDDSSYFSPTWTSIILNRIFDEDFDAWLGQKYPEARVFRDRQLAKGSDPMRDIIGSLEKLRPPYEGIDAIYSTPEDREGCRQLMSAVAAMDKLYYERWNDPEWTAQFKAWYRANRQWMRYDYTKHRFVVTEH